MRPVTRHFLGLLAIVLAAGAASAHPWGPDARETVAERFPAPPGTTRLEVPAGSFAAWLRTLPVKPPGTEVRYFNGAVKPKRVHAAVIDLDVGERDLQQCADAVMRLRAEYLFAAGCRDEIAFDFASGDRAAWSAWARGERPRVDGNQVTWSQRAAPDASYENFRRYLDTVFAYAGSASLERELEPVALPSFLEPGDVFIQGGYPGHAVIVLDVVQDGRGERRFLLAQSYMPAQDLHVLERPGSESPWYEAQKAGPLITPEWRFRFGDLRRFPSSCAEPIHLSGDVIRPQKLQAAPIDHRQLESECAIRQFQSYILRAVIDTRGRIESAQFFRPPSNACFADHVRRTLSEWRFEPATLDGEPVRIYYHLSGMLHVR